MTVTVNEYIAMLTEAISKVNELCQLPTLKKNDEEHPCKGCLLGKNAGKPCPVIQLMDVRTALKYAVKYGVQNITGDTDVETAQVVSYMRRAVVDDISVRMLRHLWPAEIADMNLVRINSQEVERYPYDVR